MSDLVATRRSLHGVAELLLAGPQHATSGTIRLAPTAGGFSTVARPAVRVEGSRLTYGERTVDLDGRTVAEVAEAVGLTPKSPAHLYRDDSGVTPTSSLRVDDRSAARLAGAFEHGAAALRELHPDAEPVLWPEHFDVGITVDRVNLGVSPGDDFLDVPYAYVGPHFEVAGPFWNAPFGAARPLDELADLVGWFAAGAKEAAA